MIPREDVLHEELAAAVALLDDVIRRQPNVPRQELVTAIRKIANVRNALIGRARTGAADEAEILLRKLNSAISVITSGEYPVAGERLARLRQGHDSLVALLKS